MSDDLVLDAVTVRASDKELLSDVSLALAAGELVALIGPNGAGKTTLLRTAVGLLAPARGRVLIDGEDVRRLSPRERAARVGWLPQQSSLVEPLPVLEVVIAARYRFAETRAASERAARTALSRVRAEPFAARRITELSGGERQRVALATLLAQEPRIALLDEPASHLDPAQQVEAYRLIGELWRQGLGVLLVTHDVNLLGELGPAPDVHVVGLAGGRVAFRSNLAAADLPEQLGALFRIPFASLDHQGRRVLLPTPKRGRT